MPVEKCGCGREKSHKGACKFRREHPQGRESGAGPGGGQPSREAKAAAKLEAMLAPFAKKEARLVRRIGELQEQLEQLRGETAQLQDALKVLRRPALTLDERLAIAAVQETQDGSRGTTLPDVTECAAKRHAYKGTPQEMRKVLAGLLRKGLVSCPEADTYVAVLG